MRGKVKMKDRASEKGTSFTGVIIAVGLMGLLIVGVIGLITRGHQVIDNGDKITVATALGQEIMEQVRKMPYGKIAYAPGQETGDPEEVAANYLTGFKGWIGGKDKKKAKKPKKDKKGKKQKSSKKTDWENLGGANSDFGFAPIDYYAGVGLGEQTDDGVFVSGVHPIREAGADGLYLTEDDGAIIPEFKGYSRQILITESGTIKDIEVKVFFTVPGGESRALSLKTTQSCYWR